MSTRYNIAPKSFHKYEAAMIIFVLSENRKKMLILESITALDLFFYKYSLYLYSDTVIQAKSSLSHCN